MNFEQLRSIVKNIKLKVTCPYCDSNFMNEDIHIMSSVQDKAVLVIQCHSCESPLMVTASLKGGEVGVGPAEGYTEGHIGPKHAEHTDNKEEVLVDDVLNVHEFLQGFEGDFSDMFGGGHDTGNKKG